MRMGMSMCCEPKMLLAMACPVCGAIHDMPEDAATTEKVEDIANHITSNPNPPRRRSCPKCGYHKTSTWYIAITKSGNVRTTEKPSTKSTILAGPYNKWEIRDQLARFWNQGKVPHTLNNEILPSLRCCQLLLEQGNILEAQDELRKGLEALENIKDDVARH